MLYGRLFLNNIAIKEEKKDNQLSIGTIMFGERSGFIKGCLIDIEDISVMENPGTPFPSPEDRSALEKYGHSVNELSKMLIETKLLV